MKLKYYLRGLGIGIMVASVLMGIALGGDKERLSDAEIMARAKDLGMVESSVLADLGKDKENKTPVEEISKEEVNQETKSDKETVTESETETTEPEEKQDQEPAEQPKVDEEPQKEQEKEPEKEKEQKSQDNPVTDSNGQSEAEYVTLVINRGESSVSVSKSLAELGLVKSAKDYDRFLCENGYDKSIKVGTHKIKVGSTEEEIAEIISRKKK